MKKNRIVCLLGMCMLAAGLQTGCGSNSYDMSAAETTESAAEEIVYEDEAGGIINSGSTADSVQQESVTDTANEAGHTERKLIKTVDMNLETENYDSFMSDLEKTIEILGGYIEYRDAYYGSYSNRVNGSHNRNATLTARIPADSLSGFTDKVGKLGNITYESESVEDVTLQYVDLASHKKVLVTEQERLMALLENADNMEDIITIESRLSEVRYQIESMESQLRTYDNQVDYSTVHMNVKEVEKYTPQPQKGAWERIKTGFADNVSRVTKGIKNAAVEFIIALPVLFVWAVVIMAVVLLVRFFLKKKHRKDIDTVKENSLFKKHTLKNKKEEEKE